MLMQFTGESPLSIAVVVLLGKGKTVHLRRKEMTAAATSCIQSETAF